MSWSPKIIETEERILDPGFDYSSLPSPPEHLPFEGKILWWKLSKELDDKGRLSESVKDILESYCIVKGQALEFFKMISNDGKIVGGKIHPLWKPMIEAFASSKALFNEIGFIKKESLNLKEEESNWDKSLLA